MSFQLPFEKKLRIFFKKLKPQVLTGYFFAGIKSLSVSSVVTIFRRDPKFALEKYIERGNYMKGRHKL